MQHLFRVILLVCFFLAGVGTDALAGVDFSYGSTWWGGGFQGKISFSNDAGNELTDWTATFNVPFKITTLWGAKLESEVEESDGSNTYTVSAEDWNNVLAADGVMDIGFNGQTDTVLNEGMVRDFALSAEDSSPPASEVDDSEIADSSDPADPVQNVISITSDWGTGFGGKAEVAVDSSMDGWTFEFDFNGEITSIWNAEIISHSGSRYIIGPLDWNSLIADGATVSFGFNARPGNVTPSDFSNVVLNGNPVSSSDTGDDGGEVQSGDDDSGSVVSGDDAGDSGTTTADDDAVADDSSDSDAGLPASGSDDSDGGDTEYTGKKIVGYFVQWGIYGRDYQVADIPGHKLTHINYAFAGIDGTTLKVKSVDEYADFEKVFPEDNGLPAQTWSEAESQRAGNFGRMRQLKQKYPHLKVMLSIGGWTLSTFFSDVALTADSRACFAASAVAMMIDQGLDGIDLDWEYPVSGGLPEPSAGTSNEQISFEMEKSCQKYRPEDRDNYVLLVRELRRQLEEKSAETGRKYLLSIAAPAGTDKIVNFDLENMEPYLDYINLMTYDFHGGWENVTGHQASMKVHPGDSVQVSVESAVTAYLARGVPAEKLVAGLPFYGRAWEGVPSTDNGILQTSTGIPAASGPGNWEAGVFDYWLINDMAEEDSVSILWDNASECSYAYGENLSSGGSGGMFITFDDVRSVRNKAVYIESLNLGGAMFWELSGDVRDVNSENSLLGALAAELIESGTVGSAEGESVSADAGSGSYTEDSDETADSGEAASDAPAKPVIAWIDPQQSSGDYTVAWNMWWGDNGVSWALFENGEQVYADDLAANSPQAQSGSAALTGRDSGEYSYTVRLYGLNGAYSESDPVVLAVGSQEASSVSSDDSVPVTDAGDGSRYSDDRDADSFVMDDNLAFQVHVNTGQTRSFSFDKPIEKVISRNPDVAGISVSGASISVSGLEQGRSGLRIDTEDGKSYFMGLRVDSASGEQPGLPGYLAVGSVSEDTSEDLSFWQNTDEGLKNRRMDIRYIYINGGPVSGWTSWGADRARKFARESLKLGMIPFFVFYNIPDGGESYYTDLEHVQDSDYMDAYYSNLEFFLSEVTAIMKGELYGIILEPDFLGYMQQNSGKRPGEIATVDGTVTDTVKRINSVIAEKGGNVLFGWQLNLWASAGSNGAKGLVRRTDTDDWAGMDWSTGREYISRTAEDIAAYAIEAGVLSHGADFLSIDKYGLDAGVQNPEDPAESTWFWNCEHWSNYLLVVKALKRTSGLPVILWQIPVGHINCSTETSVYTGEQYPALTNTYRNYEDSAASWFLGDTFLPGSQERMSYFLSNRAGDQKISAASDSLSWGSHMQETAQAGAVAVLFGAGVGQSTDGVGAPPSDDYFWIQKVQQYYLNGTVSLE